MAVYIRQLFKYGIKTSFKKYLFKKKKTYFCMKHEDTSGINILRMSKHTKDMFGLFKNN